MKNPAMKVAEDRTMLLNVRLSNIIVNFFSNLDDFHYCRCRVMGLWHFFTESEDNSSLLWPNFRSTFL